MKEVTLEETSWNLEDLIASGDTEQEFITRCLLSGAYKGYKEEDRITLLKKVYEFAHGSTGSD